MLPPRIESTRRKKRRSKKIWLLLPLLAIGFLSYRYGQPVYFSIKQRLMPENVQLLESRSSHIDSSFVAHTIQSDDHFAIGYTPFSNDERDDLKAYITDSKRILSYYQDSSKNTSTMSGQLAVLEFYEVLLYLHLNEMSLLDLAGRGFLPPLHGIKDDNLNQKLRQVLIHSRKAMAIDPSQRNIHTLRLIEIFSDLLYNQRTDPYVFDRLDEIDASRLPTGLRPAYVYTTLSFSARSGNTEKLQSTYDNEQLNLSLRQEVKDLLVTYALFSKRAYVQAIQSAQRIAFGNQADTASKAEAYRIIGEVFSIQNGPAAGLPYLYQAREILKTDPSLTGMISFLDERIDYWQSRGQR